MSRSVFLLRAVNVSGRNIVPMARLREAIASTGAVQNASTYIASGNIIADDPADAAAACARLRALILREFGVDTPVIARTHDDLVRTVTAQPFTEVIEKMLHAMFLDGEPLAGAIDRLRGRLVPGEDIALVGRDLWINYSADGVQSTKLTKAVLDKALGVSGTARNLRTVRKLIELTA